MPGGFGWIFCLRLCDCAGYVCTHKYLNSSATSTLPSHQVEASFFWNNETHALSFLGPSVLLVIPSLCSGSYSFLKLVSTRCLSSAYTLNQSLLICALNYIFFLLLDLGHHAAATTTDTCYPAVSSWLEQLSSFIGVPCTLCNQWVQYDSCSHFAVHFRSYTWKICQWGNVSKTDFAVWLDTSRASMSPCAYAEKCHFT